MRALFLLPLVALAACQCGPSADDAPNVTILSPRDGETVASTVLLSGRAVDPQDGELTGAALTWTSDRVGTLGTGATLSVTLPEGAHRLALTAVDSKGNPGSAQLSVIVTPNQTTNRAPVAAITAPMNGAVFDQGQTLALSGTGTDPEDGALTGAALTWTSSLGGVIGTGTQVSFNGAALGHHVLVLTVTDAQGLSGVASVEVDVVLPGTNRAPVVTITAPLPNATLTAGLATTLTGTATDAEDGVLTGASLVWTSSVDGALGTGATVSATLTRGVHVLTLTATDSMGAATSANVMVSVNQAGNQAPTVTITAPTAGQTFFAGSAVTFTATASDPEDGALTGASLAWTSSRDGALGTGASLASSTLTAGAHVVTCVATDSGGNTATATVALTVLAANAAPTVTITTPAAGATFTVGSAVSMTGTASDPEDGALVGAALTWRSDLDGVLGTGASLTSMSLRAGTHTLTLTAIDSGGRSASASVGITVSMGTANVPPIARLTGPSSGMATQLLTFSGATSSDSDGTVASYAFSWGDGSPATSGATPDATHAWAMPGTFTVTLTVTDDRGAMSSATLVVTVSPFVRSPVVVDQAEPYGVTCSLSTRGTVLHVAYFASTHPTVYYSTWDGTTLTREVVDGLGFGMGGRNDGRLSLALDASGTPHVLWVRSDRPELWYAVRTGAGTWQRERADSVAARVTTGPIALTLDAANGEPVAVWPIGTQTRIAIGRRTGGAWAIQTPRFTTATSYEQPTGDVAVIGGKVYVPFAASVAPATGIGELAGTTPSTLPLTLSGVTSVVGSSGRLFVMSSGGLNDVALGTPFTASTSRLSLVQASSTNQHAVTLDGAGRPRLVTNLGSSLETVTPRVSDDYWEWASLGAIDSGQVDVAVDSAGDTRACFFRAGRLLLY